MVLTCLGFSASMDSATLAKARELGVSVLPDNKTHRNRIEIASETSNRVYIVAQRKTNGTHTGRWECSCMGWIRHRRCKHLEAMLPTLKRLGGGRRKALKA